MTPTILDTAWLPTVTLTHPDGDIDAQIDCLHPLESWRWVAYESHLMDDIASGYAPTFEEAFAAVQAAVASYLAAE